MSQNSEERKKILLVEDEANLKELLKFRLEEAGYEVILAGDGLGAVSLARSQKPDLILLDLMLPKLDGYTVCRLLKMSDMTKQIPIIVVTARTTAQDRERGLEMGADAYVFKPTDVPSLLEKIAELIQGRKRETPSSEVFA